MTKNTYATGVLFYLSLVLAAVAGDLNPPPGPIAPTQRTPIGASTTPGDAISQFKITQPGSYYLTGNITGAGGQHGIEIAADGVTLDLMGFDLMGVAGSLDGLHMDNGMTNTAVINGSIRNWNRGIYFSGSENTRLVDLRISGNVSDGALVGSNVVITGCVAFLNGHRGFYVGGNGSITNCCARSNADNGIYIAGGSIITNSTARLNGGAGILSTTGCTIINCSVLNNLTEGINAGTGNTISYCTAYGNTLDGIRVGNDSTVRANSSNGNGQDGDGAGIHATGTNNRIDANNCTNNDRGIDVDSSGNFITRNTCSNNPTNNWDVVAANNILVILVVDAPAVLGNSGGVSPGSTDPNANYSY